VILQLRTLLCKINLVINKVFYRTQKKRAACGELEKVKSEKNERNKITKKILENDIFVFRLTAKTISL